MDTYIYGRFKEQIDCTIYATTSSQNLGFISKPIGPPYTCLSQTTKKTQY